MSQAVLAVVRRSTIVQHIQNIRTLYIKNHVHRMFLNNYCSQSRTMCPVLILGSLHSQFFSCPRWDSPPYCLHTTVSNYGSHISVYANSVHVIRPPLFSSRERLRPSSVEHCSPYHLHCHNTRPEIAGVNNVTWPVM